MKSRIFFLLSILVIGAISCSTTSKTTGGNDESKELDELVSNKNFEIRSDRAMPMATASMNSIANAGLFPPGSSASQINLIGNTNYLKVIGDSVSVYLPYFGERQMGGGYNTSGPGIEFEGIPEELEITKDKEKQRYAVKFKMKKDSEAFNINVTLFPNLSSSINVNSAQRFPIRYSGHVANISDK